MNPIRTTPNRKIGFCLLHRAEPITLLPTPVRMPSTREPFMRRRTQLRLESLECRETPSASRLFATSQDVGNHVFVYEATGPIVVGGDGQILNSGSGRLVASFDAYAAPFAGGVRLALGDVTGDGVEDLVTSPSSGGGH